MMMAAMSEDTTRSPLLFSEKDNSSSTTNNGVNNIDKRKPRLKHVPSRYLSPLPSNSTTSITNTSSSSSSSETSSRRFQSPSLSRSNVLQCSISVDRRGPSRPKTMVPNSKQGNVGARLGSSAASKLLLNSTRSLSVSFQGEAFSLPVSKAKQPNSSILKKGKPNEHPWLGKRVSSDGRLNLHMRNADPSDSDTDSVSSSSTSGKQEFGNGSRAVHSQQTVPRRLVVCPRFWQETNCRLRRLQDPQTASSQNSGGMRPALPSKIMMPLGGNFSPCREINEMVANRNCSNSDVPSILSFSIDLRRVKMGENRIAYAHMLRLLHNRYLQWRLINARTGVSLLVQRRTTEKHMWNTFISITELRHSVTVKRTKMLLLRQKLKLFSVLKQQMAYLEEWECFERDHSSSLVAATAALEASTLRLPIVGKTKVDIQSLKDAICSAVKVMQAIGSSISSLLSKVEEVNSLLTELVNITANEQFSLDQCTYFLCRLAAVQVNDCSLKTHLIQLNRRKEQM